MANLTVFSVKKLTIDDFKLFTGLYNDFKNRAMTDFKFDLEPLGYEDFIIAVKNGLLKCIVLYENSIPTGFLIYTTLISYAVELNIIYLISQDDFESRIRFLMKNFIAIEEMNLNKKIVTYPLLGEQEKYKTVLEDFGFKYVNQSVMKFDFASPTSISMINKTKNLEISEKYYIDTWREKYFDEAVELIHNNFNDVSDALFDPRFKTLDGVSDIVLKIIESGYGQFLSNYTKVIFNNENKIIGLCFVNVTGGGLINIPLVAVDREYRKQNLGKKLVSKAVREILEDTLNGITDYSEVNVTTDANNIAAVKMYEYCGFVEDYKYLESYREVESAS